MCTFWSGYATPNGTFIDAFPFESHSTARNKYEIPQDAVSVEARPLDDGSIRFVDHDLPAWWNQDLTDALTEHIAARQTEMESYRATEQAKRERSKLLAFLRKIVPNKNARDTVIERAGHGDAETAARHIQVKRAERAATRQFEDSIVANRRNRNIAYLKALSDDDIKSMLKKAQSRASCRLLTIHEVRHAIDRAAAHRHDEIAGSYSVARAYYNHGRPYGTFAHIRLDAHTKPLDIRREPF